VASYQENIELARKKVKILILSIIFVTFIFNLTVIGYY